MDVDTPSHSAKGGLSWSPDGSLLALAGASDENAILEFPSGDLVTTVRPWSGYDLNWSPDGRKLAAGRNIWDGRTWRLQRRLNTPGNTSTWSHDSRFLALGGGVFEVDTWLEVARFPSGDFLHLVPNDLADWSPLGPELATVAGDRIWIGDATTRARRSFAGREKAARFIHFGPAAHRIVTGAPDLEVLRLWDCEKGLAILDVPLNGSRAICLDWDHAQERIAVGSDGGRVLVLETGDARAASARRLAVLCNDEPDAPKPTDERAVDEVWSDSIVLHPGTPHVKLEEAYGELLHVTSLVADGTELDDVLFRGLVMHGSVEDVSIVACPVSDACLRDVVPRRPLRRLRVHENQISADTLKRLHANAPDCVVEVVHAVLPVARMLLGFGAVVEVESTFARTLVRSVEELPNASFEIVGVELSESADVRMLDLLIGLPRLESLVLRGINGLDDGTLPKFAELKSLHRLDVSNTKMSAAGLRSLTTALPHCAIHPSFERPNRTNIVADGLVAHLAFEESLGDHVVDSVTGDPVGSFPVGRPTWMPGVVGSAMQFDDESIVDCGNLFDPDRNDPFSIAFWMRVDPAPVFTRPIRRQTGQTGFQFLGGTRGASFAMSSGNKQRLSITMQFAETNDWHHFCVTHDGSGNGDGLAAFVDGRDVGHVVDSNLRGSTRTASPLRIGQLRGALDELRFYDRPLDVAEVLELIAEGRPDWTD